MPNDPSTYAAAQAIYDFFINEAKVSHNFACAFVAQADAESSFNHTVVGDHGHAFGLFQMHADRAALIQKGTGIDITTLPSVEDQLKGVWYELNHTEKRAFTMVSSATTAYDAGFAACRYYERPAAQGNWPYRGGIAEKWSEYFLSLKGAK